jgi:opacity protein-like surface antigen
MSGKRLCVALLSVVTVLVTSGMAQDEKNELGGILGRTFISNQGIKNASMPSVIAFGKGLTFDVDYARRFLVTPLYALSGEVVFAYNPDEDLNAGSFGNAIVPPDMKELFITPAARVNFFPTTAVSPWVSLGAGFGHFSQASSLIYGGSNPGKSTTSGVFELGLGLDVKLSKRVYIRGQVRDFWSGEPDFPLADTGKSRQHNFFVGGGAYWRF